MEWSNHNTIKLSTMHCVYILRSEYVCVFNWSLVISFLCIIVLDCGFEGEDECGDLDESITLAVTGTQRSFLSKINFLNR